MTIENQFKFTRRQVLGLGTAGVGLLACSVVEGGLRRLTGGATPTGVAPEGNTLTPAATTGPDRLVIRKELLGEPGTTSWDAGGSLPRGEELKTDSMAGWTFKIETEITNGNLQKGEVRTYDQILEMMNYNLAAWNWRNLTEVRENSGDLVGGGRYVWVASNEDGTFPKARVSAKVLWNQAGDVLKNILERELEDSEIVPVYWGLVSQLMGLNGFKDSEILSTRNTYPGDAWDGVRGHQREDEVCSRYEPDIKRGQEYIDADGVLHLSNEARFAFVFALSDKVIEVDDEPDRRLAIVKIEDKKSGNTWYLHARVIDLWSQPDDLGLVPTDAISEGRGWGSQVLPSCGAAEVVQEQLASATAAATLGATQVPHDTEEPPEKTEVPPTPTIVVTIPANPTATAPFVPSPTPPIPTPAPTNPDIIPTATQGG